MLNDMINLSVFFRLFNFAITIFIFGYLFKKYIKDGIKKEIQTRLQYLKNIKNEQSFLIENAKQIDLEIIQQNNLTDDLLKKLEKWSQVLKNEQEKKTKKLVSIKSDIESKQLIKNNILSKKLVYGVIIPEIIEENKIEILNDFSHVDQTKRYQKEIIEFIKKSL